MGLVGISFGVASAVTLSVAAFSRSRALIGAAATLAFMWGLTKLARYPSDSDMGIYVDALDFLVGGACGVILVSCDPRQYWRRIFVSTMVAGLFLITAYAWSLETGFIIPKKAYEATSNMLYAIALLCVFTRGLRDGALAVRSGLPHYRHDGAWSRPGAKWGRTAPRAPKARRR